MKIISPSLFSIVILIFVSLFAVSCDDTVTNDNQEEIGDPVDDPVDDPIDDEPSYDYERVVVIAHPFGGPGEPAKTWEVLRLSAEGELNQPGELFEMGSDSSGKVVFTPDGTIGISTDDNGKLGVFTVSSEGAVDVVYAEYDGDFYASQLVIEEDGTHALIVDGNWPNNGGGIYRIAIAADGTITEEGLLIEAKNATSLILVSEGLMAVSAKELGSSTNGEDVHLIDRYSGERLGGILAFPEEGEWVSASALSFDGRYGVFADGSGFSNFANSISVVDFDGGDIALAQDIPSLPYQSPSAFVVSPFGDTLLMLTADAGEDAISIYSFAGGTTSAPLTWVAELDYNGAGPLLPAAAGFISRGSLEGRALVAENLGVRSLQFEEDGTVTDLGLFSVGSGIGAIVGAIGVQP